MKKGIFLTAALAMALGVGVAVGAHQIKAEKVEADGDITLYCKVTQSWWKADGAAVGAHYWGGTDGTSWPGARMTAVATDNDVWKITLPSDHTNIIFTRMNPSNEGNKDWGAKTADLTIPTDGKNLYTITSESAVWGDPGVTGTWSEYEEPAPEDPTTTIYSVKIGGGSYTEMTYEKSFVYDTTHTGYQYKLENVEADAGQKFFFKKGASETIQPGASAFREEQTNNLFYKADPYQITALCDCDNATLRLYLYEDGGYDTFLSGYVANNETYYFTNNQGWEGTPKYYLFDANSNPKASWPGEDMTFVDIDPDNNYRYSFTVDTNRWPNLIIANQVGSDQTVNLSFASYLKDGFYLYERDAEHENHWTVSQYDYAELVRKLYVGGVPYDLTESEGEPGEGVLVQYETQVIDMKADDQITYRINGNPYAASLEEYGRNNGKVVQISVEPAQYDNQVLVDASAKVYVKLMSDHSVKVFVMGIDKVSKGYHVLLNDEEIVELTDSGETPEGFDGQTYSEAITFNKGDKFRLINTSSDVALPTPFSPASLDEYSAAGFAKDGDYIKYNGNDPFEATIYLKLKAGADVVYVGQTDPDIAAAKAFAIAFNEAIEAVCEVGHDNVVQKDLEDAWATQATAYAALSDNAHTELKKGTGSSINEIKEYGAKYKSVYELRAGEWDLADFMDMKYTPKVSSFAFVDTTSNASNLIVVIAAISATAVAGTAVLLVLKKRKHN